MNEDLQVKKKINVNTILNIVLLIGLAVLYILYFTGKMNIRGTSNSGAIQSDKTIPLIAFINSDSLTEKYDLFNKMKKELEEKQKALETQLTWQNSQFEKEAQAFYQKVQSGGFLTQESAQKEEQRLAEKQQQIMDMRQKSSSDLAQFEMDWHSKVLDTIASFLKGYNKDFNYDYILGYAKGGGILYASDSLDITNEVVRLLNEKYQKDTPENEKEAE